MYRNKILNDLQIYQSVNPKEHTLVKRVTAFIEQTPGCFNRSQVDGHITGSAWIVNNKQQVLLTHHKKLNIWIQLGGHADGNPSVMDVAMMEAKEESGLKHLTLLSETIFDIDVHLIPANKKESSHYHYDIRYLISAGQSAQFNMSDESIDMEWINIDQIGSYTTEDSITKMKTKYLQYIDECSQ